MNEIATTTSRLSDIATVKYDGTLEPPVEVLNRYFAPSQQHRYAKNTEKAVNGKSPFIYEAIEEVGESAVLSWLCSQLYDLADYCGARTNFGSSAVEQTARVLATQFNLRLSEYMLFFFMFKGGTYGNAGSFLNGTIICNAMRRFIAETETSIRAKIEEQQGREQSATDTSHNRISAKEYVALARADGREPDKIILYIAGELDHFPYEASR